MADIKQLQKALDQKALDTSKLNRKQLHALDNAFKHGLLKGYGSVSELQHEQGGAADTLAAEKKKQLRPFQEATKGALNIPFLGSPYPEGIQRSDFEMVGDVTGNVIPYLLDREKIMSQMISEGGRADYSIRAATSNFGKFSKLASTVGGRTPAGKTIGILGRVAAVAKRTYNFGKALLEQAKYGTPLLGKIPGMGRVQAKAHMLPTQLLQTELKSQLLGIGGAGTGSLLYGMAEAATDIGGAAQEDLAAVSDNVVDKLPPVEQEIYHAAKAMRNAMIYNGVGFGLLPLLNATGRGLKGLLGLKGPISKDIAEEAYKYGNDANLSMVMQRNRGSIARFFKDFMSTIGVFPWIGPPRQRQRREIHEQWYNNFLAKLDAGVPFEHAELLSLEAIGQMRRNFKKVKDGVGVKFNVVFDKADKIGPELRIIPTSTTRSTASRIINDLKLEYPQIFQQPELIKLGKGQLTEFDDPIIKFLRLVENMDESITAKQYIRMNEMLTDVLPNTKIHDPRGLAKSIREAFRKDFNFIAGDAGVANVLKNRAVKDQFDNLVATQGKAAGDDYVSGLTKDLRSMGDSLTDANRWFHDTVMPYSFTPTGTALKKTDPSIFTNAGLLGISAGRPTFDPNMLWESTIKQIMKSPNEKAITDLKWMLGYDHSKTGKEIFDRFRSLYMHNAFTSAYKKKPPGAELGTLFDLLDQARRKGVLDGRYVDEINKATKTATEATTAPGIGHNQPPKATQYTQDAYLKGVDPVKAMKEGIGTIRYRDLQAAPGQVAQFDVEKFVKNLGFVGDDSLVRGSKSKIVEMYGGGETGRKSLEYLEGIIRIFREEADVPISDASVFLKRRFTLGAGRAIGGGILAMGGLANLPLTIAFVLTSRAIGQTLGSPEMLKKTFDLFTNLERMGRSASKIENRQYAKLFNQWLNSWDDEPKDFPKVSPNNIDFKEISDYLLQMQSQVPEPNFNKNGLIQELRKRAFFEEERLENAPADVIAAGTNFLRGSIKALDTQVKADEADAQALLGGAPPKPQPEGANTQVPGQGVNAGQNVRANYAQLFPQDTLGQAIASRDAQQG
jgi:hypothetical protein